MTGEQVQLSVANFKANSFIIIENKKDHDLFFIIRSGRVKITSSVQALLKEAPPVKGPGDFFGVIGAMTGHVRNETAVATENVSLICVKRSQFGFLIQKNTPLAMKIIRSFSLELRNLNQELAKRTTKGLASDENPDSIYSVGDYYFQHDQPNIAAYVFAQYLRLRPDGSYAAEAKDRLESMPGIDPAVLEPRADFNRVYQDGEMVFSEFEPGHEFFIIQSGMVRITKIVNGQEIQIAKLAAGEIFGDMAILDNKPRTASAIAFGETKLMAVSRANFEKIVIQNATMATKLITGLSNRIWTIYKQLANLLLIDPGARMWDTLYTELLKQHIPLEPKKTFHFTFGPNELLKMTGLEGPAGESAVKKLLGHRVMSVRNEKIFCEDIAEIKKEVEFAMRMQERGAKVEASKRRLTGA